MPPPGDYSICRVEVPGDSDSLVYHTLSWGYDSEADAAAAVRAIAAENDVEISDIAIIKTIAAADLEKQGLLPDSPPPIICDACGSRDLSLEVLPLESVDKDGCTLAQYKTCLKCGVRSEHRRW